MNGSAAMLSPRNRELMKYMFFANMAASTSIADRNPTAHPMPSFIRYLAATFRFSLSFPNRSWTESTSF